MSAEKSDALSFVTKKVLATFTHPICVMIGDTAVFTQAAICEYQQTKESDRMDIPQEFTIVGLADGRKLTKSYHCRVGYMGTVAAMVELG